MSTRSDLRRDREHRHVGTALIFFLYLGFGTLATLRSYENVCTNIRRAELSMTSQNLSHAHHRRPQSPGLQSAMRPQTCGAAPPPSLKNPKPLSAGQRTSAYPPAHKVVGV